MIHLRGLAGSTCAVRVDHLARSRRVSIGRSLTSSLRDVPAEPVRLWAEQPRGALRCPAFDRFRARQPCCDSSQTRHCCPPPPAVPQFASVLEGCCHTGPHPSETRPVCRPRAEGSLVQDAARDARGEETVAGVDRGNEASAHSPGSGIPECSRSASSARGSVPLRSETTGATGAHPHGCADVPDGHCA